MRPLALLIVLALPTAARADLISLAGDKDSFGSGKPLGSGVAVVEIVHGTTDGDFDSWAKPLFSWTHAFFLPPGTVITGATLKIVTLDMEDNGAGDGLGGAPYNDRLYLDGVEFIGAFDDVFTADATAVDPIIPNLSIFNLAPFLGSLQDGQLLVTVNPFGGALEDAIAIDYAELTLETTVVPEPSTGLVLFAGLPILAVWSRQRGPKP